MLGIVWMLAALDLGSEGAHRFYHEGTTEFASEREMFFELSGLNHEMQRKYLVPDQVSDAACCICDWAPPVALAYSQAESIWRDYLLDFHHTCQVYADPHRSTLNQTAALSRLCAIGTRETPSQSRNFHLRECPPRHPNFGEHSQPTYPFPAPAPPH